MELTDKAGITHDFLSLGKEQPRSPGHAGGGPAIDLNVLAVKPEWSTCQTRIGTAESSGASTCRRFPYSLGKVDVTPGAGIFPSSSRRNPMDASSRLKGFADEEEEDDEEFLKETPLKGLSIKVDGSSNSGDDRKPSTPRSKHSATEQRRRSKINDRFQILRSLIPNTDQKRDKASFLLEVIEYIQLLQEKVNKYESPYPVWNQDNTKLTPWKSSQILPDGGAELQQYAPCGPVGSNGPSGSSGGFGYYHSQPRSVAGPTDNGQASWARSSPSILADPREDDLVIEGGTISLSSTYSEGLLTTLTQALQSSGVDLSTASLSVRVNLGRQAIGRDLERSSGDDSEQRQRPVKRKSANR